MANFIKSTAKFTGGVLHGTFSATMPELTDFAQSVGQSASSLASSFRDTFSNSRLLSRNRNNLYSDTSFNKLKDDINSGNIFGGKNGTAIGEFMSDYSGDKGDPNINEAKGTNQTITGSVEYLSRAMSEGNNTMMFNNFYMHKESMHYMKNLQSLQEEQLKFYIGDLRPFIEQTRSYYKESIGLLKSIDRKLDSVNNRWGGKSAQSNRAPFIKDGRLNFQAYFKEVGAKAAGVPFIETLMDLGRLIKNPAEGISALLIDGLKNTYGGGLSKINKSFTNSFIDFIDNVGKLSNSKNPLAKKMAEILSLDRRAPSGIDLSGYKNQAITLEVENKKAKAITEVIPQYLSAIYAAVSPDGKELIFDFDRGKFVDKASASASIDRMMTGIKASKFDDTNKVFNSAYGKMFAVNDKMSKKQKSSMLQQSETMSIDTQRIWAFMVEHPEIKTLDELQMIGYKTLSRNGLELAGGSKSFDLFMQIYENNKKQVNSTFGADRKMSIFNANAQYQIAMDKLNSSGLSSLVNGFNGTDEYKKLRNTLSNGESMSSGKFRKMSRGIKYTGQETVDNGSVTHSSLIEKLSWLGIDDEDTINRINKFDEKTNKVMNDIANRVIIELAGNPDAETHIEFASDKLKGKNFLSKLLKKGTSFMADAMTEYRTGVDPERRSVKMSDYGAEDDEAEKFATNVSADGGTVTADGMATVAASGPMMLMNKLGITKIIKKATTMVLHEGDVVVPVKSAKLKNESQDSNASGEDEEGEEDEQGETLGSLAKEAFGNTRIGSVLKKGKRFSDAAMRSLKGTKSRLVELKEKAKKRRSEKVAAAAKSGNHDKIAEAASDAAKDGDITEAASIAGMGADTNSLKTADDIKKGGKNNGIVSMLSSLATNPYVIGALATLTGLVSAAIIGKSWAANKTDQDIEKFSSTDVTTQYLTGNASLEDFNASKKAYLDRLNASGARGIFRRMGRGKSSPDYYSQRDSKWANFRYGTYNGTADTIGAGGCGPTVAAMMFQRLTGQKITPKDAAQIALANGYKENGTSADLFTKLGSMYGYDVGLNNGLTEAAKTALEAGLPVAFIGRSDTGDSPFGYGAHYVLGVKSDGNNISIYDPLNESNNKNYPINALERNISTSIVPASKETEASGSRGRGKTTIPLKLASKALIDKRSNRTSNAVLSTMRENLTTAARGDDDTMVKLVDSMLVAVMSINDNLSTLTRVVLSQNNNGSYTSNSQSSIEDSTSKLINYNKAVMA